MSKPNWAKLYTSGRCKEIGIPWTADEAIAVSKLGIPVEYVRDGIVTLEEYEEAKTSDEKNGTPLERQPRSELETKARELKVVFAPQTSNFALARLISQKKEKPANAKKVNKKK